jgi:pyrroline-5-carboxylate reductase
MKTIGIIGLGNMGGAIARGIVDREEYRVTGYDPAPLALENMHTLHLEMAPTLEICAKQSDIIIVAVKPAMVPQVLSDIAKETHGKTVVSIAAGVTLKTIEGCLDSSTEAVRVMPNTPALIGKGMSVLSARSSLSEEILHEVESLFSAIGETAILTEELMDAVTGLSGSGPAYVYTVIQALADGGVRMGLTRNIAQKLAAQTVMGSAAMVLESGKDPFTLRGEVTSPGGTTIEGVHALEKGGLSGTLMDAVTAATEKSRKLGKG